VGGKRARRRQLISERIALYKTEEDLGTWGAGQGRWVYDEQDKEHFVFVTIPPEALPNARARRAFKRQLEHSQKLDHPRIVAILKGGTDDGDGRPYLIQEATSGRTLAKALESKERFTPSGAVQVAVDLLNGLAYAHSQGNLEGGLSPANVLISGEGDLTRGRILTFGFARVVGDEVETPVGGVRVDTEFAAPEVLKSEPVDGRADVYSVGALLYRMLTGEPAIPVEGSKDPILHRLNQSADLLPEGLFDDAETDAAVRAAVRRALSKAPARRPTARGLALLLSGRSDDPERFAEVLPDGGTCSASGASIPPFAERPWDRKQSDRPFRCRTTGEYFAGQAHWDPRMLTSAKGADASLPEPSGEPPADVTLVESTKLKLNRDADARMRAVQELITSSKEQRPTRKVNDDRDGHTEAEHPDARSSDVVRSALIDAWETDRREQRTARHRADVAEGRAKDEDAPAPNSDPARKPTATRSRPNPKLSPALRPLPPISGRGEPVKEGRPPTHTPTGWALITLGLLLLSLFLGITLSGEREERALAENARDEVQARLGEAEKAATANALEVGDLRTQLDDVRTGQADLETAAREATEAQATLQEANTQLRSALDAMTAQAAAAREQLGPVQKQLADAANLLTAARETEARLRQELAAARSQAVDPAKLELLQAEAARLQTALTQREEELALLSAQQSALDTSLQGERAERAKLEGHVARLTNLLAALETTAQELEQQVARYEQELANRPATAAAPAAEERTLALGLATVDPQGAVQPAAGGVALAPGSRVVLQADLAKLTPLLRDAEAAGAVVALHVELSGSGKAPRAFGQALTAAGALDPDSPRRYHRAGPGSETTLRFWLTPTEARRYLKEGRPTAFVLEAPFGGETRNVISAKLIGTPVGGDAALLLRELRSKSW